MRKATSTSSAQFPNEPLAENSFGAPETVYKPGRGQTFAGMVIGAVFGIPGLAAAVFMQDPASADLAWAIGIGVAGIAFTYCIFRLRKWRLLICPGGLIQIRFWAIDKIAWSEIREVVETKVKLTGRTSEVTVNGASSKLVVRLLNVSRKQWANLVHDLLEAARRRGIAVRTEWWDPLISEGRFSARRDRSASR